MNDFIVRVFELCFWPICTALRELVFQDDKNNLSLWRNDQDYCRQSIKRQGVRTVRTECFSVGVLMNTPFVAFVTRLSNGIRPKLEVM